MSGCCGPQDAADDPGRIVDDLGSIEIDHEPGCHNAGGLAEPAASDRRVRVALIGSPNAGKTSVFNALTGLRMKTGNYPGVTVTRTVGRVTIKTPALVGAGAPAKPVKSYAYLEDLPGAYSLTPISPDEKVVADLLHGELGGIRCPDAALVIVDATVLERSLSLVAEALDLGMPVAVVLTMTDEMERRGGHVDAAGLERALGIPVRAVIGTRSSTLEPVRELLADPSSWSRPVVPPPAQPGPERNDWAEPPVWLHPAGSGWLGAGDRRRLHRRWRRQTAAWSGRQDRRRVAQLPRALPFRPGGLTPIGGRVPTELATSVYRDPASRDAKAPNGFGTQSDTSPST
jgi:ferrous iron transport protein B